MTGFKCNQLLPLEAVVYITDLHRLFMLCGEMKIEILI